MTPYSMDLRQRVLKDCDAGLGTRAVAQKYSVSESWVRRLKQRRREDGSIAPRTATPGPAPTLAAHADRLRALVREAPGLTAGEYRDRLGVRAAVVTVWRVLGRLGLTHKKSPPGGRAGPPGRGRAAGGRGGRVPAVVPAAVQPGPQPDRERV
jgi:transposase